MIGKRLSSTDYDNKLESVRTALLRGFTNQEIIKAEKISRTTLWRYKKTIMRRGLRVKPDNAEEQLFLFWKQIARWEDVIRQANRKIMSNPNQRIEGLLRVYMDATKNILEYAIKVGMIPQVNQRVEVEGSLMVNPDDVAHNFLRGIFADEPKIFYELFKGFKT